jgi:hypothetical protein
MPPGLSFLALIGMVIPIIKYMTARAPSGQILIAALLRLVIDVRASHDSFLAVDRMRLSVLRITAAMLEAVAKRIATTAITLAPATGTLKPYPEGNILPVFRIAAQIIFVYWHILSVQSDAPFLLLQD